MRRVAEIELQRMRAGLEMNRVLGLRLPVMLVRRIVRNRLIQRRQLLLIDQQMVMARARRRVARGLDRDAFGAELDGYVGPDRRAVLSDFKRISVPSP